MTCELKCREWLVRLVSRKGIHWVRLILLKVNIIIWISENQELKRNPMKSSDSRTNSKCRCLGVALVNSNKK